MLLKITVLLFTLITSEYPTLYLSIAHTGPSFPPVCWQIHFNCFIITNLICAEWSQCTIWNLLFILSVVLEVCYIEQRYKNRLIQSGCLFTGLLPWSSKQEVIKSNLIYVRGQMLPSNWNVKSFSFALFWYYVLQETTADTCLFFT